MNTSNVPISSDGASGKILLVGDISKAFFDADTITEEFCEVYSDVTEAIAAAAKNNFTAIGVVLSGISARLSSTLNALREANLKAKIILLAQMYEEPIARQFVSPSFNGISLADDYLICPIQVKKLYVSVATLRGTLRNASIPTAPQGVPATDYSRAEAASTPQDDQAHVAINEKLERRIKQLEILATTDDLTGLKNRRYIWEFCRQILEHAEKENGQVTLLIFDIDNFKHYNDVYGHPVGDKILKQAAILMQRCCRAQDVVGRIGGDEFAVVFWDDPQPKTVSLEAERRSATRPGRDHPKEVIFIAKRFRAELEKAELGPHFAKESKMPAQLHLLGPKGEGVLTISGGLAGFPRDCSTAQELFQEADKALLQAKRSGKNRIYLVGKPQSDIAGIE